MEEKLYFKPANYGKGKKKEQTKQKSEPKTNKNHKALKLVIVLLVLVIIIAVIIWLLRGRTTTTGQYPENLKNESLTCVSNKLTYSPTPTTISDNREIKINAIFNGKNHLSSANLIYSLWYDTTETAISAEAIAHANFNRKLSKLGFTAGKFNNKFTILDNRLVISAYGIASEINQETADFFMIEPNAELPKTIWDYKTVYEAQGFECTSTLD